KSKMNRLKLGRRHVPTTDELQAISLSKSERKRRALGLRSPMDRVYNLAVRLLERQGLDASTCAIWHVYEVMAEAKRLLGISCSFRAYIIAALHNPGGSTPPDRLSN